MIKWKNLCDYKPLAGEFIEVIGMLVNTSQDRGLYWEKLRRKPIRIGSHIRMYVSEFYYEVLSTDYVILKMIGPMQYRKITEYKEIMKYMPTKNSMPKFDWSYC